MRLVVAICGRDEVPETVARVRATHLVSATDPGRHTRRGIILADNHLQVHFEDREDPDDRRAPTKQTVADILAWGRTLPENAAVVVNCEAGICRSTAIAGILIAQALLDEPHPANFPEGQKELCARRAFSSVRGMRKVASPNRLITGYADMILGFDGHLYEMAKRLVTRRMLEIHDTDRVTDAVRKIDAMVAGGTSAPETAESMLQRPG